MTVAIEIGYQLSSHRALNDTIFLLIYLSFLFTAPIPSNARSEARRYPVPDRRFLL